MYRSSCAPHLWSWTGSPPIRAITEVRKKNEIPWKQRSKKKSYFLQTMGELRMRKATKRRCCFSARLSGFRRWQEAYVTWTGAEKWKQDKKNEHRLPGLT